LEEVGHIPSSAEGAKLLLQDLANRYERGSLLVILNLPFAQWTKVSSDAALTAARLDRLTQRRPLLSAPLGFRAPRNGMELYI